MKDKCVIHKGETFISAYIQIYVMHKLVYFSSHIYLPICEQCDQMLE